METNVVNSWKLQRNLRSNFINYKKGEDERKKQTLDFAREQFVEELIPVLDAYDMAFSNKEAWEKVEKSWRMGVEYIHAQLLKVLADNGVSEILVINEHQLFVLERSGVQDAAGVFKFYIRLYELDILGATDIKDIASLKNSNYVSVRKRLVLNLNEAGLPKIDNIEGIAWGRKLPNGHDTIVLVSDDNFDQTQVTQFLVFEILPK